MTGTDKPTQMTIGWRWLPSCGARAFSSRRCAKSRYSHELLETHGEFTVLIPSGDMKDKSPSAAPKSGRDTDKIATCGLTLEPSSAVRVPHIKAPGLVLECRVIYKTDFVEEALDEEVREKWYSGGNAGDLHTLYFGEILAQYEQA